MPVKKLLRNPPSPALQILRDRLVQEWLNLNSTAAQPVILEEGGTNNQPLHIYVVWDDWNQYAQVERSETIMDALELAKGSSATDNVTVAMGLTPDEAHRLGINY